MNLDLNSKNQKFKKAFTTAPSLLVCLSSASGYRKFPREKDTDLRSRSRHIILSWKVLGQATFDMNTIKGITLPTSRGSAAKKRMLGWSMCNIEFYIFLAVHKAPQKLDMFTLEYPRGIFFLLVETARNKD